MQQLSDDEPRRSAARPNAPREFRGGWVIAAMFGFGVLTTAGLWVYWYLHLAPFRPLQAAVAAEFPDSAPRVEGGQRKMHKGTPRILRITLRVDFDPNTDDDRVETITAKLYELAGRYQDISSYDTLEMYLYQRIPEQETRERRVERVLKAPAGR